MKRYIIALDQGTTSSRAVIFDKQQRVVGISQKEYPIFYPQSGWVEQDPMDIYASQYSVLTEVLAKLDIRPQEIAALGITNQRETTIVWNRHTGEPIYNAIVWQCRRTADLCEALTKDYATYIRQHTGLIIDAYFSATKIRWILDHVPGAQAQAERGDLLFGTVDSWLVWKLTGGKVHVTDYTNASRTMLYNIRTLDWDDTILQALRIPRSMLQRFVTVARFMAILPSMVWKFQSLESPETSKLHCLAKPALKKAMPRIHMEPVAFC